MNRPLPPTTASDAPPRLLPGFGPDGRTVIVALDHALASGQVPPLDRPLPLLERIGAARPDALILSAGVGRLAPLGRPWWLTADYFATSALPGAVGDEELHSFMWTAEDALGMGAAGLKCLLVFGRRDAQLQAHNVAEVTRLVASARTVGIPVMVEATLWGALVPAAAQDDPRLVAHAARIGFELGADVLKIPLPAGGEGLAELTSALPVPIVVMGGPATDPRRLFEAVAGAVDAGVRGVALGRNVWQHPDPAAFVRALHLLVHDGAPAEVALDALDHPPRGVSRDPLPGS